MCRPSLSCEGVGNIRRRSIAWLLQCVNLYALGASGSAHGTDEFSLGSLNSCATSICCAGFRHLLGRQCASANLVQLRSSTLQLPPPFVSALCIGEGIVVRLMYHILLGVCTLVLFSGSICRSSNLFLRCRHVSSAVARVFDCGYYLNDRVKRILGY